MNLDALCAALDHLAAAHRLLESLYTPLPEPCPPDASLACWADAATLAAFGCAHLVWEQERARQAAVVAAEAVLRDGGGPRA